MQPHPVLRDNCVLSHSSCDSTSSHHLLKNYCHHLETGWQPYSPCIHSTNSQMTESNRRVFPWEHPSNKPKGHMVLRNRPSICIQVIQIYYPSIYLADTQDGPPCQRENPRHVLWERRSSDTQLSPHLSANSGMLDVHILPDSGPVSVGPSAWHWPSYALPILPMLAPSPRSSGTRHVFLLSSDKLKFTPQLYVSLCGWH